MNSKLFLTLSIVVFLILSLFASFLIVDNLDYFQGSESFSEFWLLDSEHGTSNYPFNVTSGTSYSVFVNLANHMGSSETYLVNAKLRSYEQYLLECNSSYPSSSPSLYEFSFSVDDEGYSEIPITFEISDLLLNDDVVAIDDIVINGDINSVTVSTSWNPGVKGYVFQLFFELSRYNTESGNYQFDNKIVGIWLNMTV